MTERIEPNRLTAAEQQALDRFKAAIETLLGDNLVSLRLFGSRARGEATPESDLDVLVIVRETGRPLRRRIVEESLEVDLIYDVNLAPTVLSVGEYDENRRYRTPFYRNVERESRPL